MAVSKFKLLNFLRDFLESPSHVAQVGDPDPQSLVRIVYIGRCFATDVYPPAVTVLESFSYSSAGCKSCPLPFEMKNSLFPLRAQW